MIALVECADHGLLLAGGDAAEDRVVVDRVDKQVGIVGQFAGVDRVGCTRYAGLLGDSAHCRGVVAGDHLDVDVLVEEVLHGVAGVRAQPLIDDDKGDRLHLAGTAFGVGPIADRPGDEENAGAG